MGITLKMRSHCIDTCDAQVWRQGPLRPEDSRRNLIVVEQPWVCVDKIVRGRQSTGIPPAPSPRHSLIKWSFTLCRSFFTWNLWSMMWDIVFQVETYPWSQQVSEVLFLWRRFSHHRSFDAWGITGYLAQWVWNPGRNGPMEESHHIRTLGDPLSHMSPGAMNQEVEKWCLPLNRSNHRHHTASVKSMILKLLPICECNQPFILRWTSQLPHNEGLEPAQRKSAAQQLE